MNIKLKSFTMAEILLSLTIIGVVAAITLPSLTGNINERTWRAQRKALYARISQALALMGNINGYGQYIGTYTNGSAPVTTDTSALTFVTNGLSKVLKLNNICDSEHLQDCGIASQYARFQTNSKYNFPKTLSDLNSTVSLSYNPHNYIDTKVAAFETANGESVAVFYNPFCVAKDLKLDTGYMSDRVAYAVNPYICANFVFDLNGKKGPNTFGKDTWFMSALYSDRLDVIMLEPERLAISVHPEYNYNQCKNHCASINARNATVEEGISFFYNRKFSQMLGFLRDLETDRSWVIYGDQGFMALYGGTQVGCKCIYTDGR